VNGMMKIGTLNSTISRLARFCTDESGATAIEYAMIAAGVGGFIAATVLGLGEQLKTTFYDKIAALFP
jgi:pilus assembly protein Flp/PilA